MEDCRNCQNYRFIKMMEKPYGYAGDIPCLRCVNYMKPHSEFTPNGTQTNWDAPDDIAGDKS